MDKNLTTREHQNSSFPTRTMSFVVRFIRPSTLILSLVPFILCFICTLGINDLLLDWFGTGYGGPVFTMGTVMFLLWGPYNGWLTYRTTTDTEKAHPVLSALALNVLLMLLVWFSHRGMTLNTMSYLYMLPQWEPGSHLLFWSLPIWILACSLLWATLGILRRFQSKKAGYATLPVGILLLGWSLYFLIPHLSAVPYQKQNPERDYDSVCWDDPIIDAHFKGHNDGYSKFYIEKLRRGLSVDGEHCWTSRTIRIAETLLALGDVEGAEKEAYKVIHQEEGSMWEGGYFANHRARMLLAKLYYFKGDRWAAYRFFAEWHPFCDTDWCGPEMAEERDKFIRQLFWWGTDPKLYAVRDIPNPIEQNRHWLTRFEHDAGIAKTLPEQCTQKDALLVDVNANGLVPGELQTVDTWSDVTICVRNAAEETLSFAVDLNPKFILDGVNEQAAVGYDPQFETQQYQLHPGHYFVTHKWVRRDHDGFIKPGEYRAKILHSLGIGSKRLEIPLRLRMQ